MSGSYALSYSYNLVGELESITNPWGTSVYYGYDKVGRVTGVNGPANPRPEFLDQATCSPADIDRAKKGLARKDADFAVSAVSCRISFDSNDEPGVD